ncbi:TonB-dependent receptor plug domain-containing protein [Leptolyngbya sp. 7M]|uniref:AMIN domain-containing protein n=1 Tax=Leptolyngbya sp. 7M TaxID=2812896 RepID=UPI0039776D92
MGVVGAIATIAQPIAVQAIEDEPLARTNPPAPQLSELDAAATTVEEWLAQEASLAQLLTQVISIQLNGTETGLELVLETAEGQLTDPVTSVVGNALIADIPNAVLALPDGEEEFQQANPIEGIALVSVTSLPDNRVRVAITGVDAPPTADVRVEGQEFVLSVVPGTEGISSDEDAIQVVVAGEQDEGYNPSRATTATRTDTPLSDIPASITVIPRQVIEDQGAVRLDEILRNASGVTFSSSFGNRGQDFLIRGFGATTMMFRIRSRGSWSSVFMRCAMKGVSISAFSFSVTGRCIPVAKIAAI